MLRCTAAAEKRGGESYAFQQEQGHRLYHALGVRLRAHDGVRAPRGRSAVHTEIAVPQSGRGRGRGDRAQARKMRLQVGEGQPSSAHPALDLRHARHLLQLLRHRPSGPRGCEHPQQDVAVLRHPVLARAAQGARERLAVSFRSRGVRRRDAHHQAGLFGGYLPGGHRPARRHERGRGLYVRPCAQQEKRKKCAYRVLFLGFLHSDVASVRHCGLPPDDVRPVHVPDGRGRGGHPRPVRRDARLPARSGEGNLRIRLYAGAFLRTTRIFPVRPDPRPPEPSGLSGHLRRFGCDVLL